MEVDFRESASSTISKVPLKAAVVVYRTDKAVDDTGRLQIISAFEKSKSREQCCASPLKVFAWIPPIAKDRGGNGRQCTILALVTDSTVFHRNGATEAGPPTKFFSRFLYEGATVVDYQVSIDRAWSVLHCRGANEADWFIQVHHISTKRHAVYEGMLSATTLYPTTDNSEFWLVSMQNPTCDSPSQLKAVKLRKCLLAADVPTLPLPFPGGRLTAKFSPGILDACPPLLVALVAKSCDAMPLLVAFNGGLHLFRLSATRSAWEVLMKLDYWVSLLQKRAMAVSWSLLGAAGVKGAVKKYIFPVAMGGL